MRYLNKDQVRAPKREATPVPLPEYGAPLLVARPSADLAVRVRAKQVDLNSAEGIAAMMVDMLVDEDGARMLAPDNVAGFLEGISAESLRTIADACLEGFAPKAATPVPPKPSTSA